MSRAYKNRKKAIRRIRKEMKEEPTELLKWYASEYNDRWAGLAAKLVLKERRVYV